MGCKAEVLCQRKRWAEAVTVYTELQEEFSLQGGSQTGYIIDMLFARCRCYMYLGEMKQARDCAKRIKRLNRTIPRKSVTKEVKELERDLRKYEVTSEQSAETVKTLGKCSNPLCSKREQRVRQFQVCARCQVTRYCSRKCQKTHWNNGHKKYCKKD